MSSNNISPDKPLLKIKEMNSGEAFEQGEGEDRSAVSRQNGIFQRKGLRKVHRSR